VSLRTLFIDALSWLNYKPVMADPDRPGHRAAVTGDHHGLERRELGDASKLIDTTLGYLLGAEQTIVVPGADLPRTTSRPPAPPSGVGNGCTVRGKP
jgi:hypothetical protein